MPIRIEMWMCRECNQVYHTFKEAQECENRGKITFAFEVKIYGNVTIEDRKIRKTKGGRNVLPRHKAFYYIHAPGVHGWRSEKNVRTLIEQS